MEAFDDVEGFEQEPRRSRDLNEITGDLDALWREWRRLQAQPASRDAGEDVGAAH